MPLCQYCRHLNAVGVERCVKCQRWIGLGPEPPSRSDPATAAPSAAVVDPSRDVSLTAEGAGLPEQVRDVLQREGKIAAIKVYREQTGVGLAEAKAAVEAIEAGRRIAASPSGSEEALLGLLRAGRKIEAIKVYRQQTGKGLKDSKDYVEALALAHGIQGPAGGCGTAVLAVALMIVCATILYFAAVGTM